MKILLLLLVAALFILGSLPAHGQAQPTYRAQKIRHDEAEIETLGELEINDNNHVLIPLSNYSTSETPSHIWNGDSLISITTSTSFNPVSTYGLNSSGQVTGLARQSEPWHEHAYVTEDYTLTTDLQPLPPAHDGSYCRGCRGFDINDLAQVAGYTNLPDSGDRATAWFDGTPVNLGILPEHIPILESDIAGSCAYGISNNGKVVGWSDLESIEPPAERGPVGFIWENGAMTRIPPFAGGFRSNARAVNNLGQVVGSAWGETEDYQYEHAFLWQDGNMQDIHGDIVSHATYSEAWDINEAGQVVGAFKASNNAAVGAFLYTDGTTYLLDDLIENDTWPSDGLQRPSIDLAFGINESGCIVGVYEQFGDKHACLLTPVVEGYVVNANNDVADNNLGDGICNTGGPEVNGNPECSFRAAIQQANAEAGKENILFDIPGGGTPEILLDSLLPVVSDSVDIDASTQPVSRAVVINGSQLPDGNGLTITSGGSSVRGLTLTAFPGHGMSIFGGDGNTIAGCVLGSDSLKATSKAADGNGGNGLIINGSAGNIIGGLDSTDANQIVGNTASGIYLISDSNEVTGNRIIENGLGLDSLSGPGHGIRVSGSGNYIGHADPQGANVIKMNGGAGIYVEQGSGNEIRRNVMAGNQGLGIDLDPDEVNPNDSLDPDMGANQAQNYPVIDSVVGYGSYQTVYGRLQSTPTHSFIVEFYVSSQCDPSGYGEGEESVWTSVIETDSSGLAEFAVDINGFSPDSDYLTLTATDQAGNTSEFSRCWPDKKLLILDAELNPIPEREFLLYKVANDPPTFTETLVDTAETDSAGMIRLVYPELANGDSVKVYRHLHSEPSVKGSDWRPGTAYSVHLDNARFDSVDYHMYFTEIDTARVQTVIMDHTTIAFNLAVSIEWEAKASYKSNLMEAIRAASNYLYDVTDGQIRLDTIQIKDLGLDWDQADVWIRANNVEWPRATVFGVNRAETWAKLHMPRKFYGTVDENRNNSAEEIPLDPNSEINYRTFAHELGHYVQGFFDEYLPGEAQDLCPQIDNYGFMDSHYPDEGEPSSEMSWSQMYQDPECLHTNQYIKHAASCWNFFESTQQLTYDGILAEIVRPDERNLNGHDYFLGPNSNSDDLDYDVGALVQFETDLNPPAADSRVVEVRSYLDNDPLAGVTVISHNPLYSSAMLQGLTSDSGRIVALGVTYEDTILVAGPGYLQSIEKQSVARRWYSGVAVFDGDSISDKYNTRYRASAAGDTLEIVLDPVDGEYRALAGGRWTVDDFTFELRVPGQFSHPPSLLLLPGSGGSIDYGLTYDSEKYSADIGQMPYDMGRFRVWAVDDSADAFFFDIRYRSAELDSAETVNELFGGENDPVLDLDPAIGGLDRIALMSCSFLPIEDGLPDNAIQVGHTHSIEIAGMATLGDASSIGIRYSQSDLTPSGGLLALENAVRVYRWDPSAAQWIDLGGEADTNHNIVFAPLPAEGTYAAFTVGESCCLRRGDVDHDGVIVNISDLVFMIAYVFQGGAEPPCMVEADLNASGGLVDISDVVYLVAYMFQGGPAPVPCPSE